jgi:lipoprotein-releasing system permease protein
VAERIQRDLGFPYFAEDWTRLWPNLFSALKLEKTVYFLVLLLMVLIGAFNIISTLVMVRDGKEERILPFCAPWARRRKVFVRFFSSRAVSSAWSVQPWESFSAYWCVP